MRLKEGKMDLRDKFCGALLGTSLGDAAGAGWEGAGRYPEEAIEATLAEKEKLRYTDDAAMAIGIAESLVAQRGFDGEKMTWCFIKNYQKEPWRGYGSGPPAIFRRILQGEAWDAPAQNIFPGGSYGNGAAMRATPIGLYFRDEGVAEFRDYSYQMSRITHAHPLGMEGGALQAHAVKLASNLEPDTAFNPQDFLQEVKEFSQEDVYLQKLAAIEDILERPDKGDIIQKLGRNIEAFNSMPTALACFLLHPKNFQKCIIFAVSLGGDTDTIAAMAGGITGAYLGYENLPKAWLDKLENREYIETLARDLYAAYQERGP